MQITFDRIGIKEMKAALPMFEYNALRILNSQAESSRALFDALEDCLEYIEHKKLEKVTEEIAVNIWKGDF